MAKLSAKNKKTAGSKKKKKASSKKKKTVRSAELLPAEESASHQGNPEEEIEDAELVLDESEVDKDASEDAAGERGLVPSTKEETDLSFQAISPADPLRRYLEEVSRHRLLDPQEEIKLAKRMIDDGNIEAAKQLVQANLRLVVKIAFEYRSIYTNIMDLIQEGNIGLMKAVSKFDPTKGARLGYYASWWIRSYILKYLIDNFRLVKVGTTQAQKKLFYHLMREKQRLEAQGLPAPAKLLAEKLNVKEKEVVEMEQRLSGAGAEMSLDAPVGDDDSSQVRLDFLSEEAESAEEALAGAQMLEILRDRLPEFEEKLNEKEKSVLHERLLADDPKTLQEVADLYGLTRERVRQIESRVIQKLRVHLSPDI